MTTYTKRIMKAGNSLFVPVPFSVVELWGLQKGAEIRIEFTPDEMRITPVARISGRQVQESDLERFWQAMKKVEVKTSLEDDGCSLRVQFYSPDPDVGKALAANLRKVLPAVLSMLGIRPGDEKPG